MEKGKRTARRITPKKHSKIFRKIRIFFRSLKHKRVLLAAIAIAVGAVVFGVVFAASQDPLPSWQNGNIKSDIISFVKNSDDVLTSGYIPEENRIAVIDLNGTIINEQPINIELAALKYRVQNDQWMDGEQVQALNAVISNAYLNNKDENYNENYKNLTTKALYGMSQAEIYSYIERFLEQPNQEFYNKKYSETFYKPILDLIDLLQRNNFEIYVITSSQRDIARAVLSQKLNISSDHIIGLDAAYFPKISGASSNSYIPGDDAVRGWSYIYDGNSDFKVEKVVQSIGKRPVFAVGNSPEDFSLLNYTASNPEYNSLALLILHDDNVKENAYFLEEHSLWKLNADQNNWKVVSVAQDYKTIFN